MASAVASLASLLKQTHVEDDEEVLKAANAALKLSKNDLDTQHVKIVALLKLDRFDEALRALESGGNTLQEKASLEYAYALYKSGRLGAAAQTAHKSSQRANQHVEAQSCYRNEDFERAAELYRQLSSSGAGEDAEADLRVNGSAVDAQLEWSGDGHLVQKKKPSREDLEAFETAYNAACGSIARGELGQAEVLLKRATELCSTLEDMSPEEMEAELSPIAAQQIYVLSRLGKHEEAEKVAQDLHVENIPSSSSRHIAQNNSVAASASTANAFLAERLAGQGVESLRSDPPFQFQSAVLKQNAYAMGLQSQKFDGITASTSRSLSNAPLPSIDPSPTSLAAINAAAHAKNQVGKEGLKHILPVLEQRPADVGLVLTIIQIYVMTGNLGSATSLLESFLARLEHSGSSNDQDVRFAPGLVATLVSLYSRQGRRAHIRIELAKATTHWRRKSDDRSTGNVHLLKAGGAMLLESPDVEHLEFARDIFADLRAHNVEDRYVAAGLLAASPRDASEDQVASLTTIDRLIRGVDAEALENAGVAHPPTANATVTIRKRPAEDSKPKKPNKIRKTRMPKDYDPNKTPDPERWLPLKDRSTYRPKGKRSKARQALLSQGAVANDSDGSRPATPGGEIVKQKQGGGGGGGSGNQKKKKGKGGKW